MTWVSAGVAVGGMVLGAMNAPDDVGGGAGATSANKDPWAPAAPWLKNNIKTGQSLQDQYAASPFNQQQLAAHGALSGQTDYMNKLIPSLLGQLGTQSPGFDRHNPHAQPQAFNFNGMGGSASQAAQPSAGPNPGLLGMLGASGGSGYSSAANPAQIPSAVAPTGDGTFVQSNDAQGGGYGRFNYGDPMPEPGTQAYRDMSSYFNNGGFDPKNTYGRGVVKAAPYQPLGDQSAGA